MWGFGFRVWGWPTRTYGLGFRVAFSLSQLGLEDAGIHGLGRDNVDGFWTQYDSSSHQVRHPQQVLRKKLFVLTLMSLALHPHSRSPIVQALDVQVEMMSSGDWCGGIRATRHATRPRSGATDYSTI